MARGRAAAPGSDKPKERHPVHFNLIFRSARQITYFVLFTLWICLSIVELGLVSQQIHRFGGRFRSDWPTQEYGHAMGLLLFTSIISLLFGLFHWALSLFLYLPIFLAMGVWWGTGAGIFESTPFGHGLQCGNPTASFPAAYQPYVSQCSRVTAIEGLAWAMFALAVIGLFFTFVDKFSIHSRRNDIYDLKPDEEAQPINRAPKA
uniref:MARVEL domain-containing protein n=1 Tax=Tremella fuciformis TaxID=64657 RepID=D5KXY9_9TREE|nr:unknown [Tremella fuciformis]ADE10047.1 unknown [Tremella fuciformis]